MEEWIPEDEMKKNWKNSSWYKNFKISYKRWCELDEEIGILFEKNKSVGEVILKAFGNNEDALKCYNILDRAIKLEREGKLNGKLV